MLQLSLLRHAKSSWEHDNVTDHERPLKGRGFSDATIMAQELEKRKIFPDCIASSTSKRTRETVNIFCEHLKIDDSVVIYDRTLYHAWAKGILEFIQQNAACSHIMVVGHNPGIHEFVEHMTDTRIERFPTCAYALLSLEIDSWKDLQYGSARMQEFLYPSMFR